MDTLADILTNIGLIITAWIGYIPDLFNVIAENPVLFFSVLLAFAGAFIFGSIKIIKRLKRSVQ